MNKETLTQKFRRLEAEADALLAEVNVGLKEDLPAVYYLNRYNRTITKFECLEANALVRGGKPIVKIRATQKAVASMEKYLEAIRASRFFQKTYKMRNCTTDEVCLYCFGQFDDTTWSRSYDVLASLKVKLDEEYEKYYKPREGYRPCAHCSKQFPIDKLHSSEIRHNGRWVKMEFCSTECSSAEAKGHD